VLARRQAVTLFPVARIVRQDEIVTETNWIPSPSDKVIHVRLGGRERASAVKAPTVLDVDQRGAHRRQCRPLAAEQEFVQVRGFARQRPDCSGARIAPTNHEPNHR
jgi:hypothetical protein